jgi:outer membrane protein OmpA-like peptidoglycan-associated protein
MNTQILAGLAIALVATPAWTAETNEAPKEEKIGVGSGAVIGAIAGGPIGMVLGAALGGWTGDRFHEQRSKRDAAEAELAAVSAERDSLETKLRGTAHESAMHADGERRFKAALEEALEVQVYFDTEQSTLDEDTDQRLAQVARLIGELDGVEVVIEGYADSRGEAIYNEQLSAARAMSVRDTLMRAGVPMDRITVHAVGETQAKATETDTDALAFERKVSLTITRQDSTLVGELR